MKSVLLSIKPEYCELIASGQKTVEIRKNRPKIDVPFKCYIYCTLANSAKEPNNNLWLTDKTGFNWFGNGMVIGEFVCKHINTAMKLFEGTDIPIFHQAVINASCLSNDEVEIYGNGKTVYAWHISDLVIYDEPKGLSEFVPSCYRLIGDMENTCDGICNCEHQRIDRNPDGKINTFICTNRVQRPPQGWCYVEGLE